MKTSPYSPQYEELRLWLRREREARGLTLRDVSNLVGRHHSIIGKLEQSSRKIDIVEYVLYCRVLGIDPEIGLGIIQGSLGSNGPTADAPQS